MGSLTVACVRVGENCDSWQGGSMDFGSSNSEWIWAAREGQALDTD